MSDTFNHRGQPMEPYDPADRDDGYIDRTCFRCGQHAARFCTSCVDHITVGEATYADIDYCVIRLIEAGVITEAQADAAAEQIGHALAPIVDEEHQ